ASDFIFDVGFTMPDPRMRAASCSTLTDRHIRWIIVVCSVLGLAQIVSQHPAVCVVLTNFFRFCARKIF
ncbi:MAG: hypothetical protein PVF30_04275, partial [Desulfobacterales bacterium]